MSLLNHMNITDRQVPVDVNGGLVHQPLQS